MSRLIDSIRKLGQQSLQPIGFGALTGSSETQPALALIGRTDDGAVAGDLDKMDCDVLDAVILDTKDASSLDTDAVGELIWGVECDSLSDVDVEMLVSKGCDFFVIDPESAPASLASQVDPATILDLKEPLDRETVITLRALNVDGSLNITGIGSVSDSLSFQDLIDMHKIAASAGGVMLVEVYGDLGIASLAALRDIGVDGLVVDLSDTGCVEETARKIRELPPRKRAEPRGFGVTAPQATD